MCACAVLIGIILFILVSTGVILGDDDPSGLFKIYPNMTYNFDTSKIYDSNLPKAEQELLVQRFQTMIDNRDSEWSYGFGCSGDLVDTFKDFEF